MTANYTSTCHCRATVLTLSDLPALDDESQPITSCNCSICTKHGLAIRYCKRRNICFEKGEHELKSYMCGSQTRVMRFCGVCGVVMLFDALGALKGADQGARESSTVVAVNACAIDGYDSDEAVLKPFDGKSVPIEKRDEGT